MDKSKQKIPEILVGVIDDNAVVAKSDTVKCKVIQTLADGIVGINYNGYGVQVKIKEKVKVGDTIEIQVSGKIGTKDFKCRSVK